MAALQPPDISEETTGARETSRAANSGKLDDLNPWPGLAAYDEASQAYFQGRDDDAVELLRLIRLAPLTALYGKSGLGKSSLLQAGLFPRLRAEHFLPVYLRVDFSDQAQCPPLEQVVRRLDQEIATVGADCPPSEPGEDLWQFLHRRDTQIWSADNFPLTPVLVFDQFEEIFSRSGDRESIGAVFDALADLIENRIPAELASAEVARERRARLDLNAQRYRIVLAFREDFLPDLETWKDKVPSLLRSRLRLLPMSRLQAIAATGQAGKAVLAVGVAEQIVDFVANREADSAGAEPAVEPVLLSLCCTQLNRRRPPGGKIDAALVASTGQDILQSFYGDALAGMPERVPQFIETQLIQGDRYRGSYPRDAAIAQGLLSAEELASLTDRHRLLRIDQQQGVARIELIHDRLVGIVAKARDERLANERERKRVTEQAAERAEAERRQRDEIARQTEQERAKRLEAEARAGRAFRRWALGLAGALLLALGFATAAYHQTKAAKEAARTARDAEARAKQAQEEAEKRTKELLRQFGWQGETVAKTSAHTDLIEQSLKANQLIQQAPARRERRSAVTVQYFPKDVDQNRVDAALTELGFQLSRSKANVPGMATNSIWFGSPVDAEDVKLVALTLIRAGVQIRAIRPFKSDSPNKNLPKIQVGADMLVAHDPPLSVEKIQNALWFSRTE